MASLSEIVLAKSFDTDSSLNAFQQTLGTGMKAAALASDIEKNRADVEKASQDVNTAKFTQIYNRLKLISNTPNDRLRAAQIEDLDKTYQTFGLGAMTQTQKAHLLDPDVHKQLNTLMPAYRKRFLAAGMTPAQTEQALKGAKGLLDNMKAKEQMASFENMLTAGETAQAKETEKKLKAQKRLTDRGDTLNREARAAFKKLEVAKTAMRDGVLILNELNSVIDNPMLLNTQEMRTKIQKLGFNLAKAAQGGGQLSETDVKPFNTGDGFFALVDRLKNLAVSPTITPAMVKALSGSILTQVASLDDHISREGEAFRTRIDSPEFTTDEIDFLTEKSGIDVYTAPVFPENSQFTPKFGQEEPAIPALRTPVQIMRSASSPEKAFRMLESQYPEDFGRLNEEEKAKVIQEIIRIRQQEKMPPQGGTQIQPFPALAPEFQPSVAATDLR